MNVSEGKAESARPRALWRKVAIMIAASAVAIGALIAVPTAANATGDHDPTQGVNCDTISADYHRPLVNGDHINVTLDPPGGQVNMYVDQNIPGGASYNGQNNLGLRWKLFGADQTPIPLTIEQIKSGVINFNYAAAVKNLGINNWVVTFVQTNSIDTWPNLPCGETPPEIPLDASASVSVDQQATCDSPSTVKFDIVNATWDSEADLTVGDHTRSATSNEKSLFPNGTNKDTVNYTVEDKKPSQSTDPSGDCYVPPTPTCVEDATYSYTFDPATGSGVVTADGSKDGEELCEPLFVRAVAYEYVPPTSGAPSWPQDLVGYNDTTVDKTGTFSYGPPQVDACRQYDVYASFEGFDKLKVSEHLEGPNNPFEPAFLHDVLAGKGPNPTYSYTTSEGCNTPPPVIVENNPKYETSVECGKAVLTFTNKVTLKEGETTNPAVFTYSDAEGEIQEVSVPANETVVKTVEFAEDSGDHQVTVGPKGEEQEKLTVHTDCEANPVPYTPKAPTSVDKCGTVDDTYTVPGKLVESASSTDKDGNIHATASYVTDKGGYDVEDNTIDGVRTVKITGYVNDAPDVFIPEPGEGDTYVLKDGFAVWTFQFTNEKCEPVPPTTPPTTTPPVDHPKSPGNPQKPAAYQPPSVLASTGATFPTGIIGGAALLMLVGALALVTTTFVRRRRNSATK